MEKIGILENLSEGYGKHSKVHLKANLDARLFYGKLVLLRRTDEKVS